MAEAQAKKGDVVVAEKTYETWTARYETRQTTKYLVRWVHSATRDGTVKELADHTGTREDRSKFGRIWVADGKLFDAEKLNSVIREHWDGFDSYEEARNAVMAAKK